MYSVVWSHQEEEQIALIAPTFLSASILPFSQHDHIGRFQFYGGHYFTGVIDKSGRGAEVSRIASPVRGWRCNSACRVFVWHAEGPGFSPEHCRSYELGVVAPWKWRQTIREVEGLLQLGSLRWAWNA